MMTTNERLQLSARLGHPTLFWLVAFAILSCSNHPTNTHRGDATAFDASRASVPNPTRITFTAHQAPSVARWEMVISFDPRSQERVSTRLPGCEMRAPGLGFQVSPDVLVTTTIDGVETDIIRRDSGFPWSGWRTHGSWPVAGTVATFAVFNGSMKSFEATMSVPHGPMLLETIPVLSPQPFPVVVLDMTRTLILRWQPAATGMVLVRVNGFAGPAEDGGVANVMWCVVPAAQGQFALREDLWQLIPRLSTPIVTVAGFEDQLDQGTILESLAMMAEFQVRLPNR